MSSTGRSVPGVEIRGCQKLVNGAVPGQTDPVVNPGDQITIQFQIISTRATGLTSNAVLLVDGSEVIEESVEIPANNNAIVEFGPFTPSDVGVGVGQTVSIGVDIGVF